MIEVRLRYLLDRWGFTDDELARRARCDRIDLHDDAQVTPLAELLQVNPAWLAHGETPMLYPMNTSIETQRSSDREAGMPDSYVLRESGP